MIKRPKHRGSRASTAKLPGTEDVGALLRDGMSWHVRGRPDMAMQIFDRVLARHPGNPDAIHLGCVARVQQRDYGSALEFLKRWGQHPASQHPAAQYFAGYGHYLLKRYRSALDHLEPLIRQNRQFGLARLLAARILAELGDRAAALDDLNAPPAITATTPSDSMTHANVLALLDQHDKARHQLLALSEAGSMEAECLYELVRLPVRTWPRDVGKRVDRYLGKPGLTVQQRVLLQFSAGRIADHEKRYTDAFGHFAEAKKLATRPFDFAALEQAVEQANEASATLDSATRPEGAGLTPVFILGLPRSGKTIVERLLAERREITACGELFPRMFIDADVFVEADAQQQTDNMSRLRALSRDRLDALADQYVEAVRAQFPVQSDTRFITNTLPHNALNLHILRPLFPDAKFIYVERNRFDTFIFSFMRHFQNQFDFTRDFETWTRYHRLYEKQIEYWRPRLGSNLLTVRYEDVVGSTNPLMQSLCEFFSLPGCQNTDDKALSDIQLTTDYIGHWRNYADHLPSDRSE